MALELLNGVSALSSLRLYSRQNLPSEIEHVYDIFKYVVLHKGSDVLIRT